MKHGHGVELWPNLDKVSFPSPFYRITEQASFVRTAQYPIVTLRPLLCVQQYDGEYYQGKFEGKGKLITRSGRYEGEFINGLREGTGKFTWSSGAVYTGQWKTGRMHGEGSYVWPDDRRYEGDV